MSETVRVKAGGVVLQPVDQRPLSVCIDWRGSNTTATSNPHVAHVKYITNLFVNYTSLKMKQGKKASMAAITHV